MTAALAAVLAAVLVSGCAGAPGVAAGRNLSGERIEVLAVWSGVEQQHFQRVLDAFERETGASVSYVPAGHSVPDFLQARLAAGKPPDVAFLPQPGLLRQYAREHLLVPLDGIAGNVVADNYGPVWQRLGSVDGKLYGVWFKAANKSLIWYNVGVFERAGVVPPTDFDGLEVPGAHLHRVRDPRVLGGWRGRLDAGRLVREPVPAPRRPGALRPPRRASDQLDGPVRQSRAAAARHRPRARVDRRRPARSAGDDVRGIGQADLRRRATPPAAAMVFEGDFVASIISGETRAELGVDADVFPFPAIGQSGPAVVGGGDAAVLMRRSRAGEAFIRYLASPQAAAIWAAQGGFVSPNLNLDLSVYPDEISRSIARSVLEAGDEFRFGISDLEPAAFGGTEHQGMRKILQDFLISRDVNATAARLEAAAAKAFAP